MQWLNDIIISTDFDERNYKACISPGPESLALPIQLVSK